jgi:putative endonuclease
MTKHNQQVGKWGEETASKWLKEHGYIVLGQNIRTPYGEIDIIAQKENVTIFIEVKALTSSKNFFPEHQITARKREHMLNAAEHYATENKIDQWQVDVIAIEGKQMTKPKITHFENAI